MFLNASFVGTPQDFTPWDAVLYRKIQNVQEVSLSFVKWEKNTEMEEGKENLHMIGSSPIFLPFCQVRYPNLSISNLISSSPILLLD